MFASKKTYQKGYFALYLTLFREIVINSGCKEEACRVRKVYLMYSLCCLSVTYCPDDAGATWRELLMRYFHVYSLSKEGSFSSNIIKHPFMMTVIINMDLCV